MGTIWIVAIFCFEIAFLSFFGVIFHKKTLNRIIWLGLGYLLVILSDTTRSIKITSILFHAFWEGRMFLMPFLFGILFSQFFFMNTRKHNCYKIKCLNGNVCFLNEKSKHVSIQSKINRKCRD